MYRIQQEQIKFRPQHKRVLRDTVIDAAGPGTILRDFAAFLAYFLEQRRPLTRNHQLKLKDLPILNARLTRPIEHGLKRPQQKSFPHLNGLYLLLRASGLTYVDTAKKTPVLVVDEALYEVWQALNPTERYCTLLETWLLRGHPQIIGERDPAWRCVPETFGGWGSFFIQIPDSGLQIAGEPFIDDRIRYTLGWHNLGLLELFGLLDVQAAPPQLGQAWLVERSNRTLWGDALLGLLYTEFFNDFGNILALKQEGHDFFGAFHTLLQTYFPAWQTVLRPPDAVFQAGVYIFKVLLCKDVWWRIAIPAEYMLDDLAYAILHAAQFDSDHLYRFSYQNRLGIEENVHHAYMDEGPWTSEVYVGDLPLQVGQTMDYLFDFGDDWHFAVTLERIDPPDATLQQTVILEAHGEAPEQYPSWEK